MAAPAPVTISLVITPTAPLSADAADALRRELTQAARWYGVAPAEEPSYALARGAVLFGRDWADGAQRITWAREDVDAAAVRACAGSLMRTWARIAEVHAPGCVAEFSGALALNFINDTKREAA